MLTSFARLNLSLNKNAQISFPKIIFKRRDVTHNGVNEIFQTPFRKIANDYDNDFVDFKLVN